MSEWIKRSEQKPPKGVVVVHTDGENFWTVRDICHSAWTHWLSIPAPPPRTVTVEIPMDVASRYAGLSETFREVHVGDYECIAKSCRNALRGKE